MGEETGQFLQDCFLVVFPQVGYSGFCLYPLRASSSGPTRPVVVKYRAWFLSFLIPSPWSCDDLRLCCTDGCATFSSLRSTPGLLSPSTLQKSPRLRENLPRPALCPRHCCIFLRLICCSPLDWFHIGKCHKKKLKNT